MTDEQKKIALFIDADNISAKYGKHIIENLQSRGEILIRRIYGNWEKIFLHKWNECILNYGLLAVQQMDFAVGKNATDMSLTIDAMDVLYQKNADVFAIVSSDSDFTPLAVRLRERGVYVIGMGKDPASNSFRSACNEFIDLDELGGDELREDDTDAQDVPAPENKIPAAPKIPAARIFKVSAKKFTAVKKFPSSKTAINTQQKKSPATKVESKKSSGENVKVELSPKTPAPTSKIFPTQKNLQVSAKKISLAERFVKCGQNGMRKPKKKLQQIHEVLQESAKAHADARGFSPLNRAGYDLKRKNLGFGVKDFGYNFLHEFIGDFPELYELIRVNSRSFRYRCK